MPRNRRWSEVEVQFLNGALQQYGDPKGVALTGWSEEVKAMVRANLADRSESGIYQQVLSIIKARNESNAQTEANGWMLTTGA
ncbi:MAG: hypothetical protein MN733_40800 [Nitrososphaera sp.]|nr:hypothetical protein [Nitrososphaera sp.]